MASRWKKQLQKRIYTDVGKTIGQAESCRGRCPEGAIVPGWGLLLGCSGAALDPASATPRLGSPPGKAPVVRELGRTVANLRRHGKEEQHDNAVVMIMVPVVVFSFASSRAVMWASEAHVQ